MTPAFPSPRDVAKRPVTLPTGPTAPATVSRPAKPGGPPRRSQTIPGLTPEQQTRAVALKHAVELVNHHAVPGNGLMRPELYAIEVAGLFEEYVRDGAK
jgi:hypothetical protein